MSAAGAHFGLPASSAGMTHAPAPGAPSRESFFALYWDHARDVSRFNLCVLAGFPSADIPELQRQEWAALMIWERDKLRAALLQMVTLHAEVVAEAQRSRELRGEKVPA